MKTMIETSMKTLIELTRILNHSEENVYKTLKLIKIGLWEYNVIQNKISWDDTTCSMFELGEKKIMNEELEVYQTIVLPEYHADIQRSLANCMEGNGTHCVCFKIKSNNYAGYKRVFAKGDRHFNKENEIIISGVVIEIPESSSFFKEIENNK